MGNKCTTPTKNPLFDDTDLNDYDRTIFNLKREKVFYGTIAICVLYGSFALLLFILSYFSDKVKYLLLNSFLPFTIVYVIGTILIVMYLIHQVLNFKPHKLNKDGDYDSLSCPDYWVLERIPQGDGQDEESKRLAAYTGQAFESNAVGVELFKYRCVLNSNIFNTYDIFKASSNIDSTNVDTYTGKYHFFNVSCNAMVSPRDSNLDILSDRALLNNNNANNYYPNQLYANVYYDEDNQYNNINTKIFRNDSNLKLKYELAKAALLMNNYKILNYKDDRSKQPDQIPTFTDFYKYHNNNEINSESIRSELKKLGITVLNFDYKTDDANAVSHANDSIIRVYTNTGEARICSRPALFTNNHESASVTNCSQTNSLLEPSGPAYGHKIDKLPLNCERLYPLYMSTVDKSINSKNRNFDANTIRCAYSKICGVPWSDMNCDKYYDD
jgi:hypothetical protein